MFKVNFVEKQFPAVLMFKIFKTEEQAELFIADIGDKFVSMKMI